MASMLPAMMGRWVREAYSVWGPARSSKSLSGRFCRWRVRFPSASAILSGHDMGDPRRLVPRTDALLADPRLAEAERVLGRTLVKAVVAQAQQQARAGEIDPEQVAEHAVAALPLSAASLRPVINATGVVVHTNLGRAPLSRVAIDAVVTASGATDVEFDLKTGRRARRGRGALAALARAVPTAGGVHVVNNNAAALLLAAT